MLYLSILRYRLLSLGVRFGFRFCLPAHRGTVRLVCQPLSLGLESESVHNLLRTALVIEVLFERLTGLGLT